ncbi:uncharacterized protein LOC106150576 [Lingula anatina]|uniref:Uncharacterized protein LOC106150576 n=1 Tax=Lingula anatina TaxID=7574 RepID=A0A1S3GYG0_LINAN|nr:uncharacterized protein LOC106150576 [Lingula anatina]|eukprot:XP_013378910.1 uncharacterized protein LOC106150576 [Lingula anatina]
MPLAAVTEEAIQRFQTDGAVCLRGVFAREWVQKVAAGIEKNLARSSQYSERLQAPGGTGYFFNDYFNWREIEEFKDYVYNSPAAEIAGTLMQSPVAIFYHEHVLTKDPHTLKATPWHHDQAYYPVDGFKNCSIWMPIDSVPAETTLKFVKGSHRWGRWFHPKKFKSEKNYPVNDDAGTRLAETRVYENVPDIDGSDEYEILQWPIEVM